MATPADPRLEVRRAVRAGLALAGPTTAPAATGADARTVVIACSGGADSLALADATVAEARTLGLTVRGVVVDHGLQPGSAERAATTAEVLHRLGVADAVVRAVGVDGPGGPEAAARRARYAALESARPPGAPVLLGHTLDDQAETVLLGLGRGSGARSLSGMRVWDRPWCRPLLGVRRATTRAACAAAGLTPWDDPHNADPRFTRVRLRHEVLPLLEDVLAGGVAAALARTAAQLADDDAALDALAAARAAVVVGEDGSVDALALAADPPAVRRRVLRAWLAGGPAGPPASQGTGLGPPSDAQLRAVDALVAAWRGQGAPPLPGGLEVVRHRGRLHLRPL